MSLLSLLPMVGEILDRVVPDKNARANADIELKAAAQSGELDLLLGQLAINKEEAKHPSIFVSGWRPFVGWTCGWGLAYDVIISPFLGIWLPVPEVDTATLITVLSGMLGIAGLRTYEKFKGVARER